MFCGVRMEGATQTVTATDNPAEAAALAAREAVVEGHFARISGLMSAAETLAEFMLNDMTTRLRQGAPVYPGELIQLCRGLHVLAKCGVELRKQLRPAGKGAPSQGGITAAQIDLLEARLRPLFEQRAA